MMKNIKKQFYLYGLLFVLLQLSANSAYAQKVGVKTNLLYDATTTLNLGVELGLAKQWTLDLSGNYNAWLSTDKHKLKHWLIQPEVRYWLCQKFNGHFFGLHAHYAKFNAGGIGLIKGLKHDRAQGTLYGAGLSYGYQWILSDRWGIEGTVGVGYARVNYNKYRCWTCSEKQGPNNKNYFGPTKIGVTLIYVIK